MAAVMFAFHSFITVQFSGILDRALRDRLTMIADSPALAASPVKAWLGDNDPLYLLKCLYAVRDSARKQVVFATLFLICVGLQWRTRAPTMPSSVPLTRVTPPAGQEPRLGSRSAHG